MIEAQEHYGATVSTNVAMDILRKTECLCLRCEQMGECLTAAKFYEICKDSNLALMVTRCQLFNEGKQ